MAPEYYLLDTCVLSEARRIEPDTEILVFLKRIPLVATSPTVVFELARGALNLALTDPARADRLLGWLREFLATDVWIPPINAAVKLLLAEMAMTRELQRFWKSSSDPDEVRYGCDPEIAALSIVYGIPIATTDVSDYLLIHRYFPLPGLYDPRKGTWHVSPPDGWTVIDDEHPDADDWRTMILPIF